MRVLFSSTSGYGHNFPMVPLARAFVAHGHEVRWATGEAACVLVSDAGLDAEPAGLSGESLAELRGRMGRATVDVPPEGKAAFMFPRFFGAGMAPPMLADLLPLARDWRPALLVHDHAELAAPLVAALIGARSVTHSYGSAIPESFIAAAGELLAPMWAEHGLTVPPYAGCFEAPYLDICPPRVQSVPMTHIPVAAPLRPVPYTGPPATALPACVDGEPLVYLTLGTVMNQASVLRAAADGLAGLGVRLLVTVGPDADPAALGDQPTHVTVERYVSQTEVLPHCTAVVSHGGSGTFLGALHHGLPQVLLPQAADQFRNAQAAQSSGVGLALRPDEATPEAIAEAVRRILAEESFRTAAAGLAADIAAMPAPDEVVDVLERLA
ncbi:MAG: glycosyltransferase [Mycobacteriales bacterium]